MTVKKAIKESHVYVCPPEDEEDWKELLAKKHNVPRDAKFDLAWNIAYDFGHSCGLSEVAYYFEVLVVLIK